MGRWDQMKNAQGFGTKNYLNVGTYVLEVLVLKYREEDKTKQPKQNETFVIETRVVELLSDPDRVTLVRGKGDTQGQETKSQRPGDRTSLAWNLSTAQYPDSLWAEIKGACCAVFGTTVKEMEAAEKEWTEAGGVETGKPSPFAEMMDYLTANDGENVQGWTFKADIVKQKARAGHDFTKGAYDPVPCEKRIAVMGA